MCCHPFTKDIQSKYTDDYIRALHKLFDNILEIWPDCQIVISAALFRRGQIGPSQIGPKSNRPQVKSAPSQNY